jgi:hypothetical protein
MSYFDDALAAGLRVVNQLAGSPMTYHAGDAVISLPSVVEGQTRYERLDESGVVVSAIATDFMFPVEHLVFEGQPIEPSKKHWLEKNGCRYELTLVSDGTYWRYSDPNHTEYRVHTNKIK